MNTLNGSRSDGHNLANAFAGSADWRLPTVAQLRTIRDPTQGNCSSLQVGGSDPCIDPILGPTVASFYWSLTTSATSPAKAWFVDFGNALIGVHNKNLGYYVRAVRTGW